MRIRGLQWFAILLLGYAGISPTALAVDAPAGVLVSDAFVRAVPPGQPNSAAFFVVENRSAQDRALVGGRSPAAEAVELHGHTMDQGMMRMRPVERIDLPAGGRAELAPGGLHLMLIGLRQSLVPGDSIELVLLLDDGTELAVMAPVRKLSMHMRQPAPAPAHE